MFKRKFQKGFTRIVDFRFAKILNIFAGRKDSFYPNRKFTTGFTLIELLVVISIISFLSSIVLASLNTARGKARDVQRMSDMKQLQNALELYKNDNGVYPSQIGWSNCTAPNLGTVEPVSPFRLRLSDLVSGGYIKPMPKDPFSAMTGCWDYEYSTQQNETVYTCDGVNSAKYAYMLKFTTENPISGWPKFTRGLGDPTTLQFTPQQKHGEARGGYGYCATVNN